MRFLPPLTSPPLFAPFRPVAFFLPLSALPLPLPALPFIPFAPSSSLDPCAPLAPPSSSSSLALDSGGATRRAFFFGGVSVLLLRGLGPVTAMSGRVVDARERVDISRANELAHLESRASADATHLGRMPSYDLLVCVPIYPRAERTARRGRRRSPELTPHFSPRMARSAKRAAPNASSHTSKKPRTAPARRDEAERLDGDDSEAHEFELGGSDGIMSDGGSSLDDDADLLNALDGQKSDEEDEEDSIAEDGQDEGSDLDDQMISDDGEDLYANLDRDIEGETEEEEEEEEEDADADDDGGGRETVGTAPSAPLIAPAAELDKKRKAKAEKKLSPAELRALAFAELTASPISNVLSTQVSALLHPLTPAAPSSSPLQPILKDLHAHITSLPKQKAVSLDGLRKKGRVVPPVEGHNGKWARMDLAWEKPRSEDLRVTGAWAWGGGFKDKGEYVVEIAVAMPQVRFCSRCDSRIAYSAPSLQALLQPKDYLFPRFSVKAIHYLVVLASLLPSSLGKVSTSFSPLPGSLGYALDVRSAVKKGEEKVGLGKAKGAILRIRIVAPASIFPTNKLAPTGNVVRPPSLLAAAEGDNPQLDPASLPPTPLHSTALHLSTLSLATTHLKYHHSLATSYPAYASSVRLLRAWAQRRGYEASLGLTSDWWAWCVARSLNVGGKSAAGDVASLAAGGEAWAGWRKAVEWLAGANWTEGIWFKSMTDEAVRFRDPCRRRRHAC